MGLRGGYTFSQVPSVDIPRSVFNRSHGYKTTFDGGYLVPFYVDEALPGDTFNLSAQLFARLGTPIVPIMDNIHLDVFFFAVPNRLLWSNWQKMMGERLNPGDSIDYLVPLVASPAGGFQLHSIFDYFGVPVLKHPCNPTALHARAYNLIWNEWFRDENLQTRAAQNMGDGPDDATDYPLRKRGKRHDYFTSCLPWPQKATTAVPLPLGSSAPVVMNSASNLGRPVLKWEGTGTSGMLQAAAASGDVNLDSVNPGPGTKKLQWGADTGLMADLSTATASTINALREAFQIQRLLERDARGGTRYTELLRSHFGVISPDQRVQRPEFLGGASLPMHINPVTQTSSTDATTPQGNLAAYGVGGGRAGFSKSFTEHCVLLGLVMARADLSYQYGLPKMFQRRSRYQFYWPSFAHLGEQAVLNSEIYYQGDNLQDLEVFGYQERWAEYRYAPSKITGLFRSVFGTTIDVWHLSQRMTALPTLGAAFIEEDPPFDRVLATADSEPHILFDSQLSVKCARPMPTYSVPGMIDHF